MEPGDLRSDLQQAPESLPDLDVLLEKAKTRQAYFTDIVRIAQAEVDQMDRYIQQLEGVPVSKRTSVRLTLVSDRLYRRILAAVAEHKYCGITTISQSAGCSGSTANRAMLRASREGTVEREQRGSKYRYTITEKGMEILTRPGVHWES